HARPDRGDHGHARRDRRRRPRRSRAAGIAVRPARLGAAAHADRPAQRGRHAHERELMAKRARARLMADVWDDHVGAEFETRDAAASVATMTDDTTLIHMPTGTGGRGKRAVQEFYTRHFIPSWPDDVTVQSISRTVGEHTLV